MNRVIAVGGTGQLVLHYYLQLYLTGTVKEAFEALVVDSDDLLPSLACLQRFFGQVQYGASPSAGMAGPVPVLRYLRVKPPGGSGYQVFTGQDFLEARPLHPVRAFFNSESLKQEITYGLFARPALSAALSPAELSDDQLTPRGESTVVVGSIIGGTGGGLLGPVLARLRTMAKKTHADVRLRGVFLGEWFKPTPGVLAGNEQRFKSNEPAVFQAIASGIKELHSYVLLRGDGFPAIREKPDDKKPNLPWPLEVDPLWIAVRGLDYLVNDTIRNFFEKFEDRQVMSIPLTPSLSEALRRLASGMDLASVATARGIVSAIASEPLPAAVWGSRLSNFLVHFWRIANQVEGDDGGRTFPSRMQASMSQLWRGTSESSGLQSVFPLSTRPSQVGPHRFRKLEIPEPRNHAPWLPALFTDMESVASRAAATFLLTLLRSGGD